jgi:hypothetical protein
MTIILILFIVMAAGIILISGGLFGKKSNRQEYLDRLTKFLDSKMESIEGVEDSFRFKFNYKGKDFTYEDLEDYGFKVKTYKGFLRSKTPYNLSLSFTEKSRTTIRSNPSSLKETVNPWMQNVDQVILPSNMKEFNAHTNNAALVNKLLANDQVAKVFGSYKNRDSRGHPQMSLEISDGLLSLRFHGQRDLHPNIFDLYSTGTVEEHLDKLLLVLAVFDQLKKDNIQ